MLRDWRRRWRRAVAAWHIRPRVNVLHAQLRDVLGMVITLRAAGSRGRDSIFLVCDGDGQPVGVVRLLNPFLKRKPLASDQPFVLPSGSHRIQREFGLYQAGMAVGITPQPIWHCEDALLCQYIQGQRLSERLAGAPEQFWDLNCRVARRLIALHRLNHTHMDASLANVIETKADGSLKLIDFEYVPAEGISVPQQRLYDHLRLVESAIKHIPEAIINRCDPWLALLADELDDATRAADPRALMPVLSRVCAHPVLSQRLRSVFSGWPGRR